MVVISGPNTEQPFSALARSEGWNICISLLLFWAALSGAASRGRARLPAPSESHAKTRSEIKITYRWRPSPCGRRLHGNLSLTGSEARCPGFRTCVTIHTSSHHRCPFGWTANVTAGRGLFNQQALGIRVADIVAMKKVLTGS